MSVEPTGYCIGYVLVSAFEVLDRQDSWPEQGCVRFWRLLARAVSSRA